MGLNKYSDYSTGSSESYSPWGTAFNQNTSKASSFIEGVSKDLDAVMQEFRMNGSDSPYDPEDELFSHRNGLSGMGPSSMYLRQKSWPAPDSTPAVRLPRGQDWPASTADIFLGNPASEVTGSNLSLLDMNPTAVTKGVELHEEITEQQMRVLRSLPNAVLYPLLRELEQSRQRSKGKKQEDQECRFCKNNGERESYYRSHTLRVAGRVVCPVLRAFVCRRCGARGDRAHTLKYCPLTPAEERTKSAAMMRSLRMASGRRRLAPSSDMQDFVLFGETTPSVIADGSACNYEALPLDPIWAALEQKLML